MRRRNPITLFPFLSVLISAMGVLSLLAVMFILFSRTEPAPTSAPEPVEVRWVGAPAHVRPLLVEVQGDGILYHGRLGQPPRRIPRATLEREVQVLRELERQGFGQEGFAADRYQRWRIMITLIRADPRLSDSLAMTLHRIELDNAEAQSRPVVETRFPILLVFPDGVETYELVSYIVETATQLPMGLEPMLRGWELPYRQHAS